jgi:hypothetical protein
MVVSEPGLVIKFALLGVMLFANVPTLLGNMA